MSIHILLIQAHPDAHPHFNHALLDAYANGARRGQHDVKELNVAGLDFSFVRSQKEWTEQTPGKDILSAQELIVWADHIVLFFPLWMGTVPAQLKAFLEQTFRPSFMDAKPGGCLHGKSVRVVVTMGMPAVVYRWYFGAHGLKNLQRNILKFCGAKPVRTTMIGSVESLSEVKRQRWLAKLARLGARRT